MILKFSKKRFRKYMSRYSKDLQEEVRKAKWWKISDGRLCYKSNIIAAPRSYRYGVIDKWCRQIMTQKEMLEVVRSKTKR